WVHGRHGSVSCDDEIPARDAGPEQAAGLRLSWTDCVPVATRHGRPVAVCGISRDVFLSRRRVLHENQWTAAARAGNRTQATRPGILQEPLSMGVARCR